jgi:hypothetical protein
MAAEMGLAEIKARIERLDKLARGLAKEVDRLKRGDDDLLLLGERRRYLRAIYGAFAGAHDASAVLAGVVRRIEGRP